MADQFPVPSMSPMPGSAPAQQQPQQPQQQPPQQQSAQTPVVSEAVIKFKSCRWRRPPEDGPECCGHRDVLPMAGAHGFDPEAWCPDCTFYKLRRTPKKRSPEDYRY